MRDAPKVVCTIGMAGILLSGAMSTGCGSSKTATPTGVGGTGGIRPGTGGSAGGGGTSGASNGGAGFGGASTGGVGGRGTGGAAGMGTGGTATGGVGTGGMSAGGAGGRATGGSGTGGLSAGGSGGSDGGGSSGIGSGGSNTGGAGGTTNLDAGSADALPSLDTGPSCSSIATQAACDQRSDCHSVSDQQSTCTCTTPGCCVTFRRCIDGATVSCDGTINCTSTTPPCQAPYVPQYVQSRTYAMGQAWVDGCFDGCVLASKCSKTTTCPPVVPADGGSCGGNDLSCFYQDCNPNTTQADCQGGTWHVHTGTCNAISCTGDGTTPGTFLCRPGQICAQYRSVGGAYFIAASCIQDTCAPAPVSLQCINGLNYPNCSFSQTRISCSQSSGPGGAGGGAGPLGGAFGGGGNSGAGGATGSVDASSVNGG